LRLKKYHRGGNEKKREKINGIRMYFEREGKKLWVKAERKKLFKK
jgi:hypothetical protein